MWVCAVTCAHAGMNVHMHSGMVHGCVLISLPEESAVKPFSVQHGSNSPTGYQKSGQPKGGIKANF